MSDARLIACPHCHKLNRVPAERLGDQPTCGQCKGELFAAEPVTVTADTFAAHAGRADLPVLVDFWAPWCGPCRMMAPWFAEAAGALEPHVQLLKVNTEEEQQLAAQFGIRSIPTLVLMQNGREIARQSGAMRAPELVQWVRSVL